MKMEEKLPLLNPENSEKTDLQVGPSNWIKFFVKWVCYIIQACYIGFGLYCAVAGVFINVHFFGSKWYLHIFDKYPWEPGPGGGRIVVETWLPYPYVFLYFLILPLCIIPILMLKMNSRSLICRLCVKVLYVALLPDCYFAYFIYQNKPDPDGMAQKYLDYFVVIHPFPLCILPLLEKKYLH